MKIAICSVQEFNPMIGGIERVSVSLATELMKLGHDVIFVACRKSAFSKPYELPAPQFFLPDSDDYSKANAAEFFKIIANEKVDVILNQNAHSRAYNRLCFETGEKAGISVVSALHFSPDQRLLGNRHLWDFKRKKLKENLNAVARDIATRWPLTYLTMADQRQLLRELYARSARLVLLSDEFRPAFRSISGISDGTRLEAVNNMLSFPYHPEGRFEKEKIILFCGRLFFSQKRPDEALSVWNRLQHKLPDWKLVFVGDGPFRKELETMAKRLKIDRVEFVGFQEPQEYYKRASIFIMTSSHEGWPLTLSEAMQYGCVPIAYKSFAAITDQIEEGVSGFMVPTHDTRDMSDRILQLANDPAMMQRMSEAAVASRAKFTPERIARQWESLFQSVIATK